MFNSMFTIVSTDETRQALTIKQYETRECYIKDMHLMHSTWGTIAEAIKECKILANKSECETVWR